MCTGFPDVLICGTEGAVYVVPIDLCPTSTTSSSMARSEVATGHRTLVLIRLDDADKVRLLQGVFQVGCRSVMFRFPNVDEEGVGDMFGAVIEAIANETGGRFRVELWFWDELAAIYATPGVKFEAWYLRTVGNGVVVSPP